jgi:hypothetical protein
MVEDICNKFATNVGRKFSAERVGDLEDIILNIYDAGDMGQLTALLRS